MRSAAALLVALALAGCRSRGAQPSPAPGAQAERSTDAAPAVPFAVRDDATELMFFWFDMRGGAHAVRRPDEVPMERRELVRVDPSRPEQRAPGWVYVADLRQRGPDGAYPARAVPADALASQVLAMAGHQGPLGSPQPAAPRAPTAGATDAGGAVAQRPAVIIYGASWCSACHQAAEYLRSRHIAFVEKDIEQDPAAAQEMIDKARRAGVPTGSIPILDVRGHILAGFSAAAIDSALGG